eukprot:gnl/TRDRNA2_/TRDRNA2_122574_c0_seq1.p1 gnl/TRDRNA2_/TRDRNA2_122574_c0~~gnl/TRDRNA2_/TRDRNA2_122574_c0_seq1.p1  ORF type:complete len:112 (-),score=20.61 gnl/TRDRNA2_/TRDRNA2_122574_c0_seq1:464-799(-)
MVGRSDKLVLDAVANLRDRNMGDPTNIAKAYKALTLLDAALLFRALAKGAELHTFDAQELSKIAWAFAKACQPEAALFGLLRRAAARRLHDFKSLELVKAVWAFAAADEPD